MEIKINAFIVKGLGNIDHKIHIVNDKNKLLTEGALLYQEKKIRKILDKLIEDGTIKSIRVIKNRSIQAQLDELKDTRKKIQKSLEQIKLAFN